MMVVIIAPEIDINDEILILNKLFEAGLTHFHLRKPNKSFDQYCDYLNQINPVYHNRIVVHYYHQLIEAYNLKGIHFNEQYRRNYFDVLPSLKIKGKTMSSSFHKIDDLENCSFEFDYQFLSPVFNSISKKGYLGKRFKVNHLNKTVIGMGGVTTENLNAFSAMGFQGVGVLGSIWFSKTPIENFKKINNHFIEQRTINE